ncbi:hypothetical protein [Micromonospora marina]|uniref:hypothetical protein n=1 Tax=Micromonospora marina TaxID=307120 RepID=UPI003453DA72
MTGRTWLSAAEAAELLEVSERTVQRSLTDEEQRQAEWGDEGQGWRYKPLSTRRTYQLRRTWVERKAGPPEA